MNLSRFALAFMLLTISVIEFSSCSSGKLMTEPQVMPDSSLEPQTSGSRSVLCIYNAVIDPESGEFTVSPEERQSSFHYPLSNYYPNVLSITGYGWTPHFWADIKLKHPLPGSGIDAFDPRVIAVLPANPSVSMSYPALDIQANNSVLLLSDGYTKLFDKVALPGNANPFMLYFRTEDFHRWSSVGKIEDTRHWDMDLTGFDGPLNFYLVVDISTNFPASPQPITDNLKEPFDINAKMRSCVGAPGSFNTLDVIVGKWQGLGSIGGVVVEVPMLFSGTILFEYSGSGPEPYQYLFSGTIPNNLSAPPGEYFGCVKAWDRNTNEATYAEFKVVVDGQPSSPQAIKNFNLGYVQHLDVDGQCAYIQDGSKLHVLNISSPDSAYEIKSVNAPGGDVRVIDGYAYVPGSNNLQIIDIDPPDLASIVKTVEIPGGSSLVDAGDGFAYVAGGSLSIVDINPIDTAYVVQTVATSGSDISYLKGYLYVSLGNEMEIVDVDPPESAGIVKTVGFDCESTGVFATGNYACVSEKFSYPDPSYGLEIVDISTPESAFVVNTVFTMGWDQGVHVSGGYAYVPDWYGVNIIDIDPPGSATEFSYASTAQYAYDVRVWENYAYVGNGSNGLIIVKLW